MHSDIGVSVLGRTVEVGSQQSAVLKQRLKTNLVTLPSASPITYRTQHGLPCVAYLNARNSASSNNGSSSSSKGIFNKNSFGGLGAVGGAAGIGMGANPAWADFSAISPGQFTGGPNGGPVPIVKGKRRILIVMSATGGGHKASAEALKVAFEEQFGNKYKVYVCDLWKNFTKWPINTIGDSYNFMVSHSWLWWLSYRTTEPYVFQQAWLRSIGAFTAKTVAKVYDIYKPHLVVSVHPLLQQIPISVLKARVKKGIMQDIPYTTVVTDLTTCHPTWFYKHVTKCFVPTDEVKELAMRQGLEESQIVKHGLPIRPQFAGKLPSKKSLRKKLGLDLKAPTVLLAGGGEGMGSLERTASELAKTLSSDAQVVLICGNNKRLAEKLRSKDWPMKVVVNGFVTNMSDWMGASDCIITKAGPGTIAEALITGLPILLNGNIPCQEAGNIPYVLNNGVGAYETDPTKIAKIIADWFGPQREELARMAARAKACGCPNATSLIVRDLADMADRVPMKLPEYRLEPGAPTA